MRRPSEIREELDKVAAARMNGGMGDTGLRARQNTLEWVLDGDGLDAEARLQDAVTDLFWDSLGDELAAAAEHYDTDEMLEDAMSGVRASVSLAVEDLGDRAEEMATFCGACGGSDGGAEPHLSCPCCHGTGTT